ncbi:unnamed protein product [Anisakis simplex]|uniref:Uncharacterized protein n=1 Tax=Anisakis simplex TaxID=6269 RepID=A0A3P6P0D7_ANISI|nr:unnamed protein product [Anisakis simplex]
MFSESGEGDSELMAQVEDISAIQINQQSTTSNEKEKETSNDAQQLLESIEEELAMLLPEGTTESLPQHSASTTQSMELDSNAPVELSAAIKRKKKKK